jgi:hypothetical protein
MTTMTTMTKNSPTSRWRKVLNKVVKVFSIGIALVLMALLVAHFVWKYSGSGEWKLELEKNGIKVYSMKRPGSTLIQVKGTTRVRTKLNNIVTAMMDSSPESCKKYDSDCDAREVLEQDSTHFVQYFRLNVKPPFTPRDLVLKTQMSQDPRNKAVFVQVTALADRVPPNACCLRVKHMNNTWLYTPVENGEIEVQFTGDYDFGIPYILFNHFVPGNLYGLLSEVEKIFNGEKYHPEYAFVQEP